MVNWLAKGKKPGTSPQKPGPKLAEDMKVLVDTMKTFTKVNQIEGKCPVPEELAATVVSATLGTALEGRLTSETQMRRCLKRVRSGDNKVESKKGESVCALRNDWLTVPNVGIGITPHFPLICPTSFPNFLVHKNAYMRIYALRIKMHSIFA